jgi:uncharacterized protein
MKYLVVVLVVFVAIWWLRQLRKPKPPANKNSGTQVMMPCLHCGTHVPELDAVQGAQGVYCSLAHRDSREG